MIDEAMQSFALTLDKFLAQAAKWSPHREVSHSRATWFDRANRLCGAPREELTDFGSAGNTGRVPRRWNCDACVEYTRSRR